MPALDQLDFKGLYSLRMIKNEKDYKFNVNPATFI